MRHSCGSLQLCENRGERVCFADDDDDDDGLTFEERKEKVGDENNETKELNRMSTKVKDEIYANHWATMYWEYLINRFSTNEPVYIKLMLPPTRTISLSVRPRRTSSSSTKKPSPQGNRNRKVDEAFLHNETNEIQLEVLKRRYLDAHGIAKPIWEGLGRTISKLFEGTPGISGDPSEDEVAFRAFHKDKQAKFFESQGDIRCGNWHNFDIGKSLFRKEADDHVSEVCVGPTNYVSITTSPKRLWNIMRFDRWKNDIAIIDLRVLKRLGIAYGSTRGNGQGELGLDSNQFATKEELLVAGWIPRQAIKGFLSYNHFERLLTKHEFEDLGSKEEHHKRQDVDKRIPYRDLQANFQKDWAEFQRQRR